MFTLQIKTVTPKFFDCPEPEMRRILRALGDRGGAVAVNSSGVIVDRDGNRVGQWKWEEDKP